MIDISTHEAYVYTIANAIDLFDVHDISIFCPTRLIWFA